MNVYEVNFDGLVGPTHNYSGLSFGNLASSRNRSLIASPRQAALQGLEKMKALSDLGMKQAVLPPHERPYVTELKRLGIDGANDEAVILKAIQDIPEVFLSLCSASNMWVANAATVSPYLDTADGKTHFTPANLSTMHHRSIEHVVTGRILRAIFNGDDYVHHAALPAGLHFSDEGAANHTRYCTAYGEQGVEMFVYGSSAFGQSKALPKKFPSRQTLEASKTIARLHGLTPERTIFAQQNPEAIDEGVFHNDVIAVGDRNLLFYHEQAFLNTQNVKTQLRQIFQGKEFNFIEVPKSEVSIKEAVKSYLFNTQLLDVPGREGATLVAPIECREVDNVRWYLESLSQANTAISNIEFFDLRQSMRNGGGPACLRLRVIMNEIQINQTEARVFLDDALYKDLVGWVNKHYRDQFSSNDLRDPALLSENRTALDELSKLLRLGNIYDFQQA